MVNREDLVALRHKIEIIDQKFGSRMQSEVVINLNDGRSLEKFADAGVPMVDLCLQAQKLSEKFKALVGPVYGDEASEKTIDACFDLDQFNNAGRVFDLVVGKG